MARLFIQSLKMLFGGYKIDDNSNKNKEKVEYYLRAMFPTVERRLEAQRNMNKRSITGY